MKMERKWLKIQEQELNKNAKDVFQMSKNQINKKNINCKLSKNNHKKISKLKYTTGNSCITEKVCISIRGACLNN